MHLRIQQRGERSAEGAEESGILLRQDGAGIEEKLVAQHACNNRWIPLSEQAGEIANAFLGGDWCYGILGGCFHIGWCRVVDPGR